MGHFHLKKSTKEVKLMMAKLIEPGVGWRTSSGKCKNNGYLPTGKCKNNGYFPGSSYFDIEPFY